MKSRRILTYFVVILIALTLVACERSASTPPPTKEGSFPLPSAGTLEPVDELSAMATQTAAVQQGGDGATNGEGEGETEPPAESEAPDEEAKPEEPKETPKPAAENTPAPVKEYPVPKQYTLQKGEFPYCIARRFNVSPGALLAANGLTSASPTYTGQTLTIPQNAGAFDAGPRPLRAHPDTYTIQAGDTVFSIACLYGDVDPRAIEDANGLSGAYTLQVGNKIHIP